MSEKDLSAVISKIVEAKHKKMDAQKKVLNDTKATINTPKTLPNKLEIDLLNQEIAQLKKQLNNLKSSPTTSPDKKLYLKREISDLQGKIDNMNRWLLVQKNNRPSTIIIEPKTQLIKSSNKIIKPNILPESDSIITTLNKVSNLETPSVNYLDSLKIIKQKIAALQNDMATKKTIPSNYSLLSKKYINYKQQLYFQNNSKSIDSTQGKNLIEVAKILKENDNIDVLINGFASKKGSPVYNQNLSMQRTETIKIGLIENGIHPVRILTVYHGIDYKATTDEKARRVDISLIIRK